MRKKCPDITMVGIIPVSYPVVQTAGRCTKSKIEEEDGGPDPAVPEEGNLRQGIREDDAVKNK
jgi:hypothetical protein